MYIFTYQGKRMVAWDESSLPQTAGQTPSFTRVLKATAFAQEEGEVIDSNATQDVDGATGSSSFVLSLIAQLAHLFCSCH